MPTLTAKQAVFVAEYLVDFNATAAATRAGYSAKTAMQQGSRLLKVPKIREAVQAALAEREQLLKERAVRVLEETYGQAVVDLGDAVDADGKLLPLGSGFKDAAGKELRMPAAVRRAIASVEIETRTEGRGEDAESYTVTKIKLHDKKASQELFLRAAGKLRNKVELTGKEGAPISVTFNLSPPTQDE
ncbi:MAG TPA: terminase small subunit [Myxococcales bacterium]|nr:terminase small subunit [Myxococcales bacterium]